MKRLYALCLLLSLVAAPGALSKETVGSSFIAITDVNLVDATGSRLGYGMTVIISAGRVTAIGKTGKVKIPKKSKVVDARGKFLIPGLWDIHVHLSIARQSALPLFIANGVTSVRDMGSDLAIVKEWRRQIAAGQLIGPQIKTSGPILEDPRAIERYEKLMGESVATTRVGIGSSPEAGRRLADLANSGVDFLKIRTNVSREVYFAIAAEAKRLSLPLVGHAPAGVSLIEASDVGQRSFEHYLFVLGPALTQEGWQEVFARFIKNKTYVVPTFVSGRGFRLTPDTYIEEVIKDKSGLIDPRRKYLSASLADYWMKQLVLKKNERLKLNYKEIERKNLDLLRAMHRAGVKIMAGTDLAGPLVFPGSSLHDELALFVREVGMTPGEALASATIVPAEFFGAHDSTGTIEVGKAADLVLLEANPLEDINNTRKIAAVFMRGELLSKDRLTRMLNQISSSL